MVFSTQSKGETNYFANILRRRIPLVKRNFVLSTRHSATGSLTLSVIVKKTTSNNTSQKTVTISEKPGLALKI